MLMLFGPIEDFKEISLEKSEVVMTIAEKLITEGMEKGKLEVAGNLLRLGVEIDKVIKATGQTEDEIKKLIN